MGLLSLWLVTQAFRSKKAPNDVLGEEPFQWGKFSLVCICLFGYAIVVDWLGFVLTTFIVVLAFFHLFESTKGWFAVIKAALIAIGNYLFFVEGLGLSLPRGFLGW